MSGESVSYFLLRRTPAYILADDIFAGLNTILVARGFGIVLISFEVAEYFFDRFIISSKILLIVIKIPLYSDILINS